MLSYVEFERAPRHWHTHNSINFIEYFPFSMRKTPIQYLLYYLALSFVLMKKNGPQRSSFLKIVIFGYNPIMANANFVWNAKNSVETFFFRFKQ